MDEHRVRLVAFLRSPAAALKKPVLLAHEGNTQEAIARFEPALLKIG